METSENQPHTVSIQIPFMCREEAEIAYNTLIVDAEPKRGGVQKQLSTTENILNIELSAGELRQLRVSSNSLLDHVILVMETIQQFGLSNERD